MNLTYLDGYVAGRRATDQAVQQFQPGLPEYLPTVRDHVYGITGWNADPTFQRGVQDALTDMLAGRDTALAPVSHGPLRPLFHDR